MKGRTFPQYDDLCQAVATRQTDMDRLYCIYYFASHHITYSSDSTDQSAEGVFKSGKAICGGYSNFFEETCKRSGNTSFRIQPFSCLAKGFSWCQLDPPVVPESNHAAILVYIDNYPWLSEPTWGAGGADRKTSKFTFSYNPYRFLQPLICAIHDHFPMNGCEDALPQPLPFDKFVRASSQCPTQNNFRHESHPFARYDCTTGEFKMHFSTSLVVKSASCECKKIEDIHNEDDAPHIDGSLQTIELIKQTNDRMRWACHAVFPEVGLFALVVFLNGSSQAVTYIDNKKANHDIPFLSYYFDDSGFIPICPLRGLVTCEDGIAIIRFAAFIKRSRLMIDVVDSADKSEQRLANYERLLIPFDMTRYENVISVAFPKAGRWKVVVYLSNDEGTDNKFIIYRFDVRSPHRDPVLPLDYIASDREFVPLPASKSLELSPISSAFVTNKRVQEITAKFTGSLMFQMKPFNSKMTYHPDTISEKSAAGKNNGEYLLYFQEPGDYIVTYFVNNAFETYQTIRFGKALRAPDQNDRQQLADLKKRVDGVWGDPEYEKLKAEFLGLAVPASTNDDDAKPELEQPVQSVQAEQPHPQNKLSASLLANDDQSQTTGSRGCWECCLLL
jgi:hypothetical protein